MWSEKNGLSDILRGFFSWKLMKMFPEIFWMYTWCENRNSFPSFFSHIIFLFNHKTIFLETYSRFLRYFVFFAWICLVATASSQHTHQQKSLFLPTQNGRFSTNRLSFFLSWTWYQKNRIWTRKKDDQVVRCYQNNPVSKFQNNMCTWNDIIFLHEKLESRRKHLIKQF